MSAIITRNFIIDHCKRRNLPLPPEVTTTPVAATTAPARKPTDIGTGDTLALTIRLDLRAVSEANANDALKSKLGRKKRMKQAVFTKLATLAGVLPQLPITVTLTRFGPKKLDGWDNLRMSFKSVVDTIAMVYGPKDHDPRYRWKYGQRKAKRHAVEIKIERREV